MNNKGLLHKFFSSHVLANLFFIIVFVGGVIAYNTMPRQRDPEVTFNFVLAITALPGSSAQDVEKLVTNPLEKFIRNVPDLQEVRSDSRNGISAIFIKFNKLSDLEYNKRVMDLRREVQSAQSQLPDTVVDPIMLEISSSDWFPTAQIAITGDSQGENLRKNSKRIIDEVKIMPNIGRVDVLGDTKPELQVLFDNIKLNKYGIKPQDIYNAINSVMQDISLGSINSKTVNNFIRWEGEKNNLKYLDQIPVFTKNGNIELGDLVNIKRGRSEAEQYVFHNGNPGVMIAVYKKGKVNTIELLDSIKEYINQQNSKYKSTGVTLNLLDDSTYSTRTAINLMQNNMLVGLFLVAVVVWLFLGTGIAVFVGIGIPFIISGTFLVLYLSGDTINIMLLLGVIISLGMLVDDAVVVVEAIYYKMERGMHGLQASISGLQEVVAPVTSAVFTTISVFLPLVLMPGILGDYMRTVPVVVSLALLISLVEAYWILPVHLDSDLVKFKKGDKIQRKRENITRKIRTKYTQVLIKVLRRPKATLLVLFCLLIISMGLSATLKYDFFAADKIRVLFVNIEMPSGTSKEKSASAGMDIEKDLKQMLTDKELRSSIVFAGAQFTERGINYGDRYAQIIINLMPDGPELRSFDKILQLTRKNITQNNYGAEKIVVNERKFGPSAGRDIDMKIMGSDYQQLDSAVEQLENKLRAMPSAKNITNDSNLGSKEIILSPNMLAINRVGGNASDVARMIKSLVQGEIIDVINSEAGEEINVILKPQRKSENINQVLQNTYFTAAGGLTRLSEVVNVKYVNANSNIKHYNYDRVISIKGDLNKAISNAQDFNNGIQELWDREFASKYPAIKINLSGSSRDIKESQETLKKLFLFGISLMYLILGTQFNSYFQPLLVLINVPLAFIGVIFGIAVNQYPVSLYTLYGVVALSGIAVNASIVMISAANQRIKDGMTPMHAIIYAARRRVIPILITSITTIAGLFSLATGLGGASMVWGPVASAIVWGLGVSTILTLFIVPTLYKLYNPAGRRTILITGATFLIILIFILLSINS